MIWTQNPILPPFLTLMLTSHVSMMSWPKLYRASGPPIPQKILIRDLRVEVQNEGYPKKQKQNSTKKISGWKLEP
jgi:hypothetical protein